MPRPRATPTPIRSMPPPPSRTPIKVESLRGIINVLQGDLPKHLTRGQRARGLPPHPQARETIRTKGLGIANITPVGGAAEGIAKVLRGVGLIPQRSTQISLRAFEHTGGVKGVFRHEAAHQLLRSQNVPQRGESVIKKIQLPQDVPLRDFFRVTEQVGRTEKTRTKEQRRRLSKVRQQVLTGRERRRKR